MYKLLEVLFIILVISSFVRPRLQLEQDIYIQE